MVTNKLFVQSFLLILSLTLMSFLQTPQGAKPSGPAKDTSKQAAPAPAGKGAVAARDTARVVKNPMDTLRTLENKAFGLGERLRFEVKYGFVTAGDAIMEVGDTVFTNGRRCYRIKFSVDSKPFFNWVYKVEDRYSTFVDMQGIFPWHFEQHIREGGFTRDFIADFDQANHIAYTSEKNYPIPSYVHDMMSAFYFARTFDYSRSRPGDKVHLQNFYKDSTYQLDVKFKGRQQIEVPAGKFNCVIVEPIATEGGLFKSNGHVYVWLTDDERKMPVKVSAQIAIGSIDSDLVEIQGINGVINARVND